MIDVQKIYEQYRVPLHIRAHMQKVADLAGSICDHYSKNRVLVNREEVVTAALLHDALKVCDIAFIDPQKMKQEISDDDLQVWANIRKKYARIGHVAAISELLTQMGERSLARLVETHDFKNIIDPLKKPSTLEEKILYYADKRVQGDRIVALDVRFAEGRKQYAKTEGDHKHSEMLESAVYQLEKELLEPIHLQAQDFDDL